MRVLLVQEESKVAGSVTAGLISERGASQPARRLWPAHSDFDRKMLLLRFRRCCCRGLLLPCLLLLGSAVQSQTTTASLQGIVSNESGERFPGVRIVLRNQDTNSSTTALSGNDGSYFCAGLAPGRYMVSASAPAHAPLQVEVTLSVGEARVLNLRLLAANQGSAPRPAGSFSQSDTADSSTGGVIDSRTVRDLPVNGRDVAQAATLEAGVSSVRTQQSATDLTSGRGQRGFGAQVSISGARPQQNSYVLDGIRVNDYANTGPGSVLGLGLGADAVEQFKVMTSNYPAEYGVSSGGIVNVVTRSGSNSFHGALYEFLRNSAVDARNYFDQSKPPFRRNQFGASAGGPVRRDRTFIFGNYEGLRQSQGNTQVDTVPSLAVHQGPVDPLVAPYLALYPLPNSGLFPGGQTGIFRFSSQQVTGEDYLTARVDHNATAADKLSGTYVFDRSRIFQPDSLDFKNTALQTRRQVLTLSETHQFSSHSLVTLRGGINRAVALIGETPSAIDPRAADTSLGFIPGATAGSISVTGLTAFGGGLGSTTTFDFHWTTLQFYEDTILTRGKHSLKTGFGVERMRDNMLASSNPVGAYTFNSLADFLANRPFALNIPLPGDITPRDVRQTVFGAFLDDDYRMLSRLTLNLGVRYEMATVPTEVQGKLAVLRSLQDSQPHLGDPYFANPTLRNFEPRVGFAWDTTGSGRLVVRSGFGIFDVLPLPYEFEFFNLFMEPFYNVATPTNLPPGSFPGTAVAMAQSTGSQERTGVIEPNPRRNYVMQWNLSTEWQVSRWFSLMAGYIGSRGVHQPLKTDDANSVVPTLTPAGYVWPSPWGSGTKVNPTFGRIDSLFWRGDSYYDGLQVQGRFNPGHGLEVQPSYTWGKSIDDGSATIAADQFANSAVNLPWWNYRLNRAVSDFNIAQNLSLHFTWTLPNPKIRFRAVNQLTSGWQTGGTYQAGTGAPFTLLMGGDPLGQKNNPAFDPPDRLSGPGCANPVLDPHAASYVNLQCFAPPFPLLRRGNLGRNSLTGPGLSNLDLFLHKDNFVKRVSEQFNIQMRVEFFNAFNHTNFAPPLDHNTIFDQNGNLIPGAGLIDSTQTPSREIQFGLKLIW